MIRHRHHKVRRRDPITRIANIVSLALLWVAVTSLTAAVRVSYAAEPSLPMAAPHSYWEQCSTVSVYLDENDAYLEKSVRNAVQYIHDKTGLDIIYAGTTRTPDLITWIDSQTQAIVLTTHTNLLKQSKTILGSTYRFPVTSPQITAAFITLNKPLIAKTRSEDQTVLHELGHAVGLEHGGKLGDLMYPNLGKNTATRFTSAEIATLKEHYHCR